MKDRIKRIMEEQHMSQQVFADFIGLSPATLSSIFTGRTRPSLNVVEAIKKKLPSINTDWLLMGVGNMYITPLAEGSSPGQQLPVDQMLDFDQPISEHPEVPFTQSVHNTPYEISQKIVKNIDKEPRRVTEIRVYYDDQTYESFVPMKSK